MRTIDFDNSSLTKRINIPFLHIGLFILTFITCMIAGTSWAYKDFTEITNWYHGLTYAILILTFLTTHEFGHYFAARHHKVQATLPYYIPFPFVIGINFGTFGAVIKIKTPIPNRTALFDIGVAGPIAGFIVSVLFLIYGFLNLPGIGYIYAIHPEYISQYAGAIPQFGLFYGNTLVYDFLANIFANKDAFLPPMNEIYHYPFLNVGWFGLFVTTLNMLPMGQLDGGHIIYSMFGDKIHSIVAKWTFRILLIIGVLSLIGYFREFLLIINPMDDYYWLRKNFLPTIDYIYNIFPIIFKGWPGWIFWALISKFILKLKHPPIYSDKPLDRKRMIIGWVSLIILLLSFSFSGIYIIE